MSFLLNDKAEKRVRPAMRQAILEVIRAHGYRRRIAAKGLKPLPVFALRAPTARAAHEAARELHRGCPDIEGVLLTDNFFAPAAQLALGRRPCRLLGFGDASVVRLCDPPIPFMRLPVDALAEP